MRAKLLCANVRKEYDTYEEVDLTLAENVDPNHVLTGASVQVVISHPNTLGFFKEGESYYIDFNPVNE